MSSHTTSVSMWQVRGAVPLHVWRLRQRAAAAGHGRGTGAGLWGLPEGGGLLRPGRTLFRDHRWVSYAAQAGRRRCWWVGFWFFLDCWKARMLLSPSFIDGTGHCHLLYGSEKSAWQKPTWLSMWGITEMWKTGEFTKWQLNKFLQKYKVKKREWVCLKCVIIQCNIT